MSQAGILNQNTEPGDATLIVETTPVIDFTQAGLTSIFTTAATRKFIPVMLIEIGVSGVNVTGNAAFNVGWTATNYDELFSDIAFYPQDADIFRVIPSSTGDNSPVVPPNTIIKVNVFNPDSGTTLTGKISIIGYYI